MRIQNRCSIAGLIAAAFTLTGSLSAHAQSPGFPGGGGFGDASSAPAAAPPVFTFRYICFAAQPKRSATADKETQGFNLPPAVPAFEALKVGQSPALGPTPEAFLNTLRKIQPSTTFRLIFAGALATDQSYQPVMRQPGRDDPYRVGLFDAVSISPVSPNSVSVTQNGSLSFAPPTDAPQNAVSGGFGGGTTSQQITDEIRPGIVLDRTYSQTVVPLPDGARIVYAFCVFKGRVDQSPSAPRAASEAPVRGR